MKTINKITIIITIILFMFNSFNSNAQESKAVVNCQAFTVGLSWPITIETTVYYCCVGDMCWVACNIGQCGIIGEATHDEIMGKSSNSSFSNKITIQELLGEKYNKKELSNLNEIEISSSSFLNGKNKEKYSIVTGRYKVDKDGNLTLKIIKNE